MVGDRIQLELFGLVGVLQDDLYLGVLLIDLVGLDAHLEVFNTGDYVCLVVDNSHEGASDTLLVVGELHELHDILASEDHLLEVLKLEGFLLLLFGLLGLTLQVIFARSLGTLLLARVSPPTVP